MTARSGVEPHVLSARLDVITDRGFFYTSSETVTRMHLIPDERNSLSATLKAIRKAYALH